MKDTATSIWLRSFGYLAGGELATGLLRFVAMVLVARALGPSGFGVIGVGLAIAGYLVMLHSGLDTVGVRLVAGDEESARRRSEELVGLRLALAAFIYVGSVIVLALAPAGGEARTVTLVYSLSVFTLAADLRWTFIAVEKTRPVAVAASISAALYLLGVLLFVNGPHDLIRVPLVHIVSEAVMVGVLVVWGRRRMGSFRPRLSGTPWRRHLRAGAPLSGIKAGRAVMLGFDVVWLNLVLGAAAAGQYAAARRFVVVGMIVIGLYYNAFLPRLVKSDLHPEGTAEMLLRLAWRRAVLILVPAGVIGSLLARPSVEAVLGPDYRQAGVALSILVWSVVIAGLVGPFQQRLIASEREVAALVATTAGAAVAVVAGLLLIPPIGLQGAALAAVAGELARLAGSAFAARRIGQPATR